ncbi:MAG: hypothetical protein R3Y47_11025 [Lachnospiraceae bacterium]
MKNKFFKFSLIIKKYKWRLTGLVWIFCFLHFIVSFMNSQFKTYDSDIINAAVYEPSNALSAGDILSYDLEIPIDATLVGLELSFLLEDTLSDEVLAEISIMNQDETLVQNTYQVNQYTSNSFFSITIPKYNIESSHFTIQVRNITNENIDNASFTMTSTNCEYNFLSYTENYYFNDSVESSQLISRYTYHIGYNWYVLLSLLYRSILVASLLSTLLLYISKNERFGLKNE